MRTLDEIITELLDIDRRINRLGFIYFGKAGFNSLQPRHPRGTREGGRWRAESDVSAPSENSPFSGSGYVSDYPSNSRRVTPKVREEESIESTKITVPGPDRKPVNRVNIFVGGAADATQLIVKNSDSYNRNTYGYNYYASHNDEEGFLFATDKINKFIETLPKDTTINLIGHSYGGDSAAKIAEANPGRINILITVDPVSLNRPNFEKVKNSVKKWVNVNAISKDESPITLFGFTVGDMAAGFGGAWNNGPKSYSHFILAPHHHDYFDSLMIYKPSERDLSAQEMLNMNR